MAILEHVDSRTRRVLLARHLIGRSRLAQLRLLEPNVSGEHAILRWNGSGWEAQDLGSRNGTFVNGRRLESGGRAVLERGSVVGIGSADHGWCLVDDGPPSAMALADEGDHRHANGGFLALPSEDDPELALYQNPAGDWILDREGTTERARDGQVVHAGGKHFTLHLPEPLAATWEARSAPLRMEIVTLRFGVSPDEEYVELTLVHKDRTIELGARAHHYLLLTMARARLRDRDAGLPDNEQGWLYQDELARKLGMDDRHLNVAVFRCRQQLGEAGIQGAASIIERRKPTRQMRLGSAHIEIGRA